MDESLNTWIFQANPNDYIIHESLRTENRELWNCRQHAKKISSGDRVLIWICGKEAGIYAVGTVETDPEERPDSVVGRGYWKKKREGERWYPRVSVSYQTVLLDKPLLKKFLMWDPELDNLKIIANPRGTNFSVSQLEWEAIKLWLE